MLLVDIHCLMADIAYQARTHTLHTLAPQLVRQAEGGLIFENKALPVAYMPVAYTVLILLAILNSNFQSTIIINAAIATWPP
jgi:hypothetical protein